MAKSSSPENSSSPPTALPAGWEPMISREGQPYYRNMAANTTQWTRPTSPAVLPAGWEFKRSRSSGKTYFKNTATGETQWPAPTELDEVGQPFEILVENKESRDVTQLTVDPGTDVHVAISNALGLGNRVNTTIIFGGQTVSHDSTFEDIGIEEGGRLDVVPDDSALSVVQELVDVLNSNVDDIRDNVDSNTQDHTDFDKQMWYESDEGDEGYATDTAAGWEDLVRSINGGSLGDGLAFPVDSVEGLIEFDGDHYHITDEDKVDEDNVAEYRLALETLEENGIRLVYKIRFGDIESTLDWYDQEGFDGLLGGSDRDDVTWYSRGDHVVFGQLPDYDGGDYTMPDYEDVGYTMPDYDGGDYTPGETEGDRWFIENSPDRLESLREEMSSVDRELQSLSQME